MPLNNLFSLKYPYLFPRKPLLRVIDLGHHVLTQSSHGATIGYEVVTLPHQPSWSVMN